MSVNFYIHIDVLFMQDVGKVLETIISIKAKTEVGFVQQDVFRRAMSLIKIIISAIILYYGRWTLHYRIWKWCKEMGRMKGGEK